MWVTKLGSATHELLPAWQHFPGIPSQKPFAHEADITQDVANLQAPL
jgi:hypothetical protein